MEGGSMTELVYQHRFLETVLSEFGVKQYTCLCGALRPTMETLNVHIEYMKP